MCVHVYLQRVGSDVKLVATMLRNRLDKYVCNTHTHALTKAMSRPCTDTQMACVVEHATQFVCRTYCHRNTCTYYRRGHCVWSELHAQQTALLHKLAGGRSLAHATPRHPILLRILSRGFPYKGRVHTYHLVIARSKRLLGYGTTTITSRAV